MAREPDGVRLRHAPALLTLVALRVHAAPAFGPRAGEQLLAGRNQVVALGRAGAGVDERELVLSLDDGTSFPLRLTREIGPGESETSWRVPALPTEHAVLALREGGEGLEEKIVAVSAEFAILPRPGLPAEEIRFRDGEWKTREADAGGAPLQPLALGESGPERVRPLEDSPDAFEEPVRTLPESPDAVPVPGRSAATGSGALEPSPAPRVHRFLPLRE
jgi:hypothetical protein